MTDLPPNVYRVAQRDFDAIPGSPWVYWIPDGLRALFQTLPKLGDVAQPRQGLVTGDNFRFIRFWWETGTRNIQYGCENSQDASKSQRKWIPLVKKGLAKTWFSSSTEVVNWKNDGFEIKNFYRSDGRLASRPQNSDFYFASGIAYSSVSSKGLYFRWMPSGYICEHASNAIYPEMQGWSTLLLTALFNSSFLHYLAGLGQTININISDLQRIPIPTLNLDVSSEVTRMAKQCIWTRVTEDMTVETYVTFKCPLIWETGFEHFTALQAKRDEWERQIDDAVYCFYGISDAERVVLETDLGALPLTNDDETDNLTTLDENDDTEVELFTEEELAVRWISYAVGIVLGRFSPGTPGALGCAVYRREDFAIGSLPAPDEAEFDALVGPPERFAYVDEAGGRHVFPAEVEAALRALALPDGIAVLDAGHPRDLPALVEKALALMLDSSDMQYATCNGDNSIVHRAYQGTHTADVIRLGAGGDLRAFLSKDFFTQWHLKWYRKRPVYWPLQSAKRNYGFVLFHEKVEQYTLYILMRDYLDYKRNGVQLALGDLAEQREAQSGAARRRTERRIAEVTALQEELAEFARTLDRLARAGYEPAPDWIDDGVLLRLAPLWEVIPLWKSEPRKAWEALEAGKYDWSHIAMRYWPERVKAACRENKSYAIAHNIFDF